MSSESKAYFEAEAGRVASGPDDYAFAQAVAKINEDGGRAWQAYLKTATAPVLKAISAAYTARSTIAQAIAAGRKEHAKASLAGEIAARIARGQAPKNARQSAMRALGLSEWDFQNPRPRA